MAMDGLATMAGQGNDVLRPMRRYRYRSEKKMSAAELNTDFPHPLRQSNAYKFFASDFAVLVSAIEQKFLCSHTPTPTQETPARNCFDFPSLVPLEI